MYFNEELMGRLHRLAQSPFAQAQARLDSHALPALPSGAGYSPAQEQRAWKTIMEGGTVGNIVPVSTLKGEQVITIAGPNEQAHVLAVTLVPPLGTFGIANHDILQAGFESAFAIVQWGVGGGVAQIEVDYGRGCSFSLVASTIRIMAVREPDPADGAPVALQLLGAAVGKYPIASPTKMTRSIKALGIAPTLVANVQIPQFAKSVTCYSVDAGGLVNGQLAMNVGIWNFASFKQADINLGFNAFPATIPFMNQASFISVRNDDGAGRTANFTFVFELAL